MTQPNIGPGADAPQLPNEGQPGTDRQGLLPPRARAVSGGRAQREVRVAEVVLDKVWKRYDGDVVAVEDLSLDMRTGEFVVLVGPSGCGKSTTLRMIAGLEDISDGELRIAGARMNEVEPKGRDIAMVFQSYALYPHMTVFENMAFGLRLRGVPRAEVDRRVNEAADLLGLGPYLARKPKALSGGQRQRVAMGRAIVRSARVFLFDEPLSNLDAKLRHEVRLEIARLHKRVGATMVYVTHDQIEAMTLADRIAIMEGGRLQQYGAPLELYHRPANRFVAGFLGSPTMNFVEGHVEATPEGPRFVAHGGGLRVPVLGDGAHVSEIGIRPQAFAFDNEGPIKATVELSEPLGAETHVHVRSGETRWVATVPPHLRPALGDTLAFRVEPAHVHRFDPQGRTLP